MSVKVCVFLLAAFPFIATAQDSLRFEAASIRPTEHGRASPDATGYSFIDTPDPTHLRAQNNSLDELIPYAWSLKDNEVSGPVWLNDYTIAFDIVASAPPNTTSDQMRLMMRTLLQERFGLATHNETKTLSGYELTVGRKGAKLTPAGPDEKRSTGGTFGINATKVSMSNFADYLARNLKMPVVNKTGIIGAFDIHFLYSENPDPNSFPSLFDALEQNTGLKLQGAKVPVNILVVDHVEKTPTAN